MDDPGKGGENPVIGYHRRGSASMSARVATWNSSPHQDLRLGAGPSLGVGSSLESILEGRGLRILRDLGCGCSGTNG